jgi:hypothetical protein
MRDINALRFTGAHDIAPVDAIARFLFDTP